jgi:hypothetical protein
LSKLSLSSFTNLQSGSAITALNNNFAAIILAMENTLSRDGTSPNKMGSNLDMNSYRISNLVAAVSDTEPVRLKEFQDGMDDLETTVQSIASTTQGYLNQVITLYDNFDDIYLGDKASDPTVDNDGNTLQTGAIYWNTTTNIMKVWTGSQWTGVISTTSGFLLDDLGDVTIASATTGDILRFNGTQFVNYPDSNYAANSHTHPSSQITDFTEAAQDATGAMVDTTLVYTDSTPQLGRAAISGHISIPSGSNTASLSSFTIAQLNAAISDADASVVGHTHLLADVTNVTITAANLNTLDDGADTTLHFHASDRARANHTGSQTASTISDFDEAAQDAVGGILTTSSEISFTYSDVTPSITAALVAGSIDESKLDSSVNASLDLADSASQPGHTHLLSNVTDVTMTVANLNTLDDGVDSTLHYHATDRDRANHTGSQASTTISDFTEAAQDAVGGMVDTTLVYTDGTPSLGRASISGHISIPAGSNTASLSSFTMAQLDAAVSDGNVSYVGHTHSISDVTSLQTTLDAKQIGIQFKDEGSNVGTSGAITSIDFVGTGVTASAIGNALTVTISGGGGGGLADGDYGDITISGGGGALTIDNDVVTFAKMQDVAANSVLARAAGTSGDVSGVALAASQLLGRGATGDVAAIDLGTGLSMTGTTLEASGGGGAQYVIAITETVNSTKSTYTSINTFPTDTSVPQNTEGVEVMTHTHVPAASGNKLLIECELIGGAANGVGLTMALFRDSVADAMCMSAVSMTYFSNYLGGGRLSCIFTATGTTPITFKVRAAPNYALSNVNINQAADGSPNYGAATQSKIRVIEFDPLASFNGTDNIPPGTYGDINVPTSGTMRVILADDAPSTPAADTVRLFRREIANRQMPAFIGPAGLDSALQPFIARNKVGYWCPPGNGTTVPGVLGFTAPTVTGFTATARNVATTNMFTRMRRLGYVTAATAGTVGQWRCAAAQYTVGDPTTQLGGFHYIVRFGISDASAVSGARMFMGIGSSITPTNVEPSTLTQRIGVGHGASDTNLNLFYGGSSAQTPIDLGANFPSNTLSTDVYELALFSPPNSGDVHWQVTRLNTGHVASGTITNSGSAVLPTNTTFLTPWGYRTNNATALAVGLDVMSAYIETDQ